MQHITRKEEFQSIIKENKYVIIDFYATWCGPCKMLSPIIEEIAEEKKDIIKFVKVDTDEAVELADLFNIQSIPTVVYIKDQKAVYGELGFKPKNAILANIQKYFDISD